jgi:hypothetical protein
MIRSESYYPSLYKPYFGLYKQRFSRSLDSFSLSFSIYSCFDLYKLYLSFFDHRTTSHLTFPVTNLPYQEAHPVVALSLPRQEVYL